MARKCSYIASDMSYGYATCTVLKHCLLPSREKYLQGSCQPKICRLQSGRYLQVGSKKLQWHYPLGLFADEVQTLSTVIGMPKTQHSLFHTTSLQNLNEWPKARKPRLLDLFCCAGGAGIGYARAGFEVVGVDNKPQPNYPLPFIQADALTLDPKFIALFDAIHASPPCQAYSDLAKRNKNADKWPRLIEPIREIFIRSGLPYIIENVDGAPLLDPVVLCGTMFPELRVLRHRLFEANFEIVPPLHNKHPKVHTFDRRKSHYGKTDEWKDFVQVTGGGNCTLAAARAAMGIDWMTKGEINEAIPPAYTFFVGQELLRHMGYADQEISQTRKRA